MKSLGRWIAALALAVITAGSFASPLLSQTMEEALTEAVTELKGLGLTDRRTRSLAIDVVNGHTKKSDRDANILRSALYTVLHHLYPAAQIILEEEAMAGVSDMAVFIKGEYIPKGRRVEVTLRAVGDRVSGVEIARVETFFFREIASAENLVAVLPLEAPELVSAAREAFTKVFRSALIASGKFNLVGGDAIDRVDADRIQEEYDCTREQCSVIVAQMLNAGLVLTPTYTKIDEGHYLLAGSLKDIRRGSTVREHTVRHDGSLDTLGAALETLACRLAETCGGETQPDAAEFVRGASPGADIEGGLVRIAPRQSGEDSAGVASLILESDPPGAELFLHDSLGETALGRTPYQNFSLKAGQTLRIVLKRERHHDKRLEFRLRGGMNDLGVVGLEPAFGTLEIKTEPAGAEVWIAGSRRGATPYADGETA